MRQDRKVSRPRPLTARSVVLSTLLGSHPPELPVGSLVRVGALFGIAEGTVRVALSRLAATGDVTASDGAYRLSGRLLDRQRRQDESRSPRTRAWRGRWEIALVTADRRSANKRATLRAAMAQLRLAELREGVWLRPANLPRDVSPIVAGQCTLADGRIHGDPAALAASLWDLNAWADTARSLLSLMTAAATPADRFTVAAAMARHMLGDPLLPAELVPEGWPGPALRAAYAAFGVELRDLLVAAMQGGQASP